MAVNALLDRPDTAGAFDRGVAASQNAIDRRLSRNALFDNQEQQRQQNALAMQDRERKEELAAYSQLASSQSPKALAEQLFPQYVQSLGPAWGQVTDEQVRDHATQGLAVAKSRLGMVAPAPLTLQKIGNMNAILQDGEFKTASKIDAPYQVSQQPGPNGSTIVTDGSSFRLVEPNKQTQQAAPSGYRYTNNGALEPIPGGPSDPNVRGRRDAAPIRKEFRGLQSVKDYETVLPLVKSAEKAPDTGYGDLQLIYSVGKVLDPGSVVREGELQLTLAQGSPLQRVLGATRFNFEKGGRLTPAQRRQITSMLNERVSAYRQAYDRDFQQYSQYAQDMDINPEMVVGSRSDSAYEPSKQPDRVLNFEDLP